MESVLGATCGYKGCTNSGTWLIKHLVDGALESEYLVCADHIKYERGAVWQGK